MTAFPRPQAPGPGGPGGIAFPKPGADGAYAGDNYFQYINVPAPHTFEWGYRRGNPDHNRALPLPAEYLSQKAQAGCSLFIKNAFLSYRQK